jgi:hypothetical protein
MQASIPQNNDSFFHFLGQTLRSPPRMTLPVSVNDAAIRVGINATGFLSETPIETSVLR